MARMGKIGGILHVYLVELVDACTMLTAHRNKFARIATDPSQRNQDPDAKQTLLLVCKVAFVNMRNTGCCCVRGSMYLLDGGRSRESLLNPKQTKRKDGNKKPKGLKRAVKTSS